MLHFVQLSHRVRLALMATLPRSLRFPVEISQRPVSDFDAGINTSTAWTGHLEGANTDDVTPKPSLSKASSRKYLSESNAVHSMSDAEVDEDPQEIACPARALYAFEGKAEFRELTVEAGDELEVVKENVGEGWSLVKDSTGEIGLLPQSYYTVRVSMQMLMILILWRTFIVNIRIYTFAKRCGGRTIHHFSGFSTVIPVAILAPINHATKYGRMVDISQLSPESPRRQVVE